MKYLATIVFMIIVANAFAQQDTIAVKKGYVSQLRNMLNDEREKLSTDTLKISKQDSLSNLSKHSLDSIKSLDPTAELLQKQDSLKILINKPTHAFTGETSKVQNTIDEKTKSLTTLPQSLTGKLNVQEGIHNKTDSLHGKVNEATSKLTASQQKVQNKADSLQHKLTSGITDAQKKVEDKIHGITGENFAIPGADKLNIPDGELPALNKESLALPQTSLPNVDTKLPVSDLKLPGLDANTGLDLNKEISQVSDVNLSNSLDVKDGLSIPELPKTDALDKVSDVSGEINNLDDKLAEVEQFEGDLQKIKDRENLEKLPEDAEAQFQNIEQVKALNGEMLKAQQFQAEQQALLQRYQDKRLLQEEITRKATNVANDYLAKNAGAVKLAQGQLGKAKKGLNGIKTVKDIFTKKSDELDGKKFYQRLVPGITMQVYNSKIFTIDLATQIGYRISPRFTAGVGATYRTGISDQYQYLVTGLGVYGLRTYFDFAALKGIYVHAEYEHLKVNPKRFAQPLATDLSEHYVSSSYFGLGKKFNLSRRIKGSVLGLYRVEYDGHLPSMNKLSMRLGFDYVIRKPKKALVGPK